MALLRERGIFVTVHGQGIYMKPQESGNDPR
jgi:hypothetical protein